MPELPEVETVVRGIRPRAVGRMIARVRLARADIVSPAGTDLPPLLSGRTITAVERRAKRIIITLDDGNAFYLHLGMTGQFTAEAPGAAVRPHTHLVIALAAPGEPVELRFRDPRRFGGVFWLGGGDAHTGLGPEPLSLSSKQLAALLVNTRRAVKVALLDQRLIAGLGNIYADEALFEAGIHPLTRGCDLTFTQTRRLNLAIKKILRRAIQYRGSTLRDYTDAEGKSGDFKSRHQVYDRAGQPCRKCKSGVIERLVLGGRSTCFCPACQKR